MTNGEKMQEMFQEGKTRRCRGGVVFKLDGWCHAYDSDWWNAEYKEPTTKNDLGVDCISRAEAIKCLECDFDITGKENMKTVVNYINSAHDKIVNLPRVKQEPFKPMVEIDLYSVIKQKYIEREVLDKIRTEIEQLSTSTCTETRRISIDADDFKENVLAILDKYKAETEDT